MHIPGLQVEQSLVIASDHLAYANGAPIDVSTSVKSVARQKVIDIVKEFLMLKPEDENTVKPNTRT